MTVNLFEQFSSPSLLGIPLIVLAFLAPASLFPSLPNRWIQGRLIALQSWSINQFTQQLLTPLNMAGHKWALMFACLGAYLVTLNLLGLLPFTFTPTTQLSVSLGIALPLWLSTVIIGMRNQPTHALAHFLPEGTPPALVPILIIIETISLFIRPLALGVRMTANLTAGHLLMNLVASGAFFIFPHSMLAGATISIFLLMLSGLEVAVAMIQAYVFVLLLSLYLQE
uniref:ATP synthase subunit a n=1 Tax=Pegasus sinensis TaxID=2925224 RepID=A0AA49K4U4_9TELE|nr:ATP synthase F0 subunit 6 [Pegasus sinensis]WKY95825.1 ATP synthase F0 subunit 6 [Pegasus sinensis]